MTETVDSIARRLGGSVTGNGGVEIHGVNAIDDADQHDITFVSNDRYARLWPDSRAAAVVCTRAVNLTRQDDDQRPVIRVDDAEFAMIALLEMFQPNQERPERGIHPSATVDPSASCADEAHIGPGVHVGPDSRIDAGATLHHNVTVGKGVHIKADAEIHAGAVIEDRCVIGRRSIIQPNAVIGSDGFGFRPRPDGSGLARMPHIGSVEIDDDVEIGAGTCVDRGKFGATRIGAGTKIDNLVQIGHNCVLGSHCVITAGVCLAGSVTLGDGVMIGGQAAIKEHVTVGSHVRIWGKSGVTKDVPDHAEVSGFPAQPAAEILRQQAALRRLPRTLRRLGRDESANLDAPPGRTDHPND